MTDIQCTERTMNMLVRTSAASVIPGNARMYRKYVVISTELCDANITTKARDNYFTKLKFTRI